MMSPAASSKKRGLPRTTFTKNGKVRPDVFIVNSMKSKYSAMSKSSAGPAPHHFYKERQSSAGPAPHHFYKERQSGAGFSAIELLLAVGVFTIIIAAAVPIYGNLQSSAQVGESTAQIIQAIRTAAEKSAARVNNEPHGVFLNITPGADEYILYQGASYATRDSAYDRATLLDEVLTLSSALVGSGELNDINFREGRAVPNKTGTITITHEVRGSRTVAINNLGLVEEQ